MKLFTHQSKEFISDLMKNKIIYNNGNIMNTKEHIKYCYEMITNYAKDNISKEFTTFPIWCWYKIESANINKGIKIELNVPDNLVLLSDYYDWGGSVIPYADSYLYNTKDLESKNNMIKAFNICVDPSKLRGDIQAIIPYIKLEWIENIEKLKEMCK